MTLLLEDTLKSRFSWLIGVISMPSYYACTLLALEFSKFKEFSKLGFAAKRLGLYPRDRRRSLQTRYEPTLRHWSREQKSPAVSPQTQFAELF